jgi:hypothetical protein
VRLARVATFMWSAGTNWVVFPGTFQGASIKGNPQSTPHHPPSHSDPSGDPATKAWLDQINTFYSAATATVLQEFATTPDIDGNMLIDNTVIVYLTEVARAWDHNQQNMPLIIFGGKNTRVKGGTYLKVTGGSLATQTAAVRSTGRQRHVAGRCCRSSASTAPYCRARAARCSRRSAARESFPGPEPRFPVV